MLYSWIGRISQSPKGKWMLILLRRMPPIIVLWLGRILGLIAVCTVGGSMRRMIRSHLKQLPRKPRGLAVTRYFQHLLVSMMELGVGMDRLEQRTKHPLFQVEGESYLTEALALGRGAIVYAPHMGHFLHYCLYVSRRYPTLAVATASSPELRPIYLHLQELGCRGIDYDATPPPQLLRQLKQQLAAGGVVFLFGDFYRKSFPETSLFGWRTRLPQGAAMLAMEHDVPVIPLAGYRTKGLQHRLEFRAPIWLQREFGRGERDEAMLRLTGALEVCILEAPEQWFYWFDVKGRLVKKGERNGYGKSLAVRVHSGGVGIP